MRTTSIHVACLAGILFSVQPAIAATVTLAWDPNPESDVVGYRLYYGTTSRAYPNVTDVGKVTTSSVSGLVSGTTYFFAVTAYNSAALESAYSAEITYTVPASIAPTITLTSPANGATYAAPATINLAGNLAMNGHTFTKVQFYSGVNLLSEIMSAPYTMTWNNVNAGSYNLLARLVYDGGSILNSPSVNVMVLGLPPPWQTADIGSVSAAGSATFFNGVYTVKGAGNINSSADNFRFVYQLLSADGEIKARINSVTNSGSGGRTGVMIRESLTSSSRYAFMGISNDGTFRWQRRINSGGGTSGTTSLTGTPPNVWIRLVRTGNSIYGYKSTDGVNWTLVNSRNITMAANIYIGLAVASGSSSTLSTATFSDLTVIP
jgi:hypothetical protein